MSLLTLFTSAAAAPAAFSPADLFASGEKGYWYDPSDFSTMFQDAAGTTPVTATGQFVGKVLDKSGNGNHLEAVSAAARGVLQQDANGFYYVDCDGIDDGYKTVGAVNAGAAAKATLFFAFKPDVFTLNFLVESSAAATAAGTYLVSLSDSGTAGVGIAEALFVDTAGATSKAQSTGFTFVPTIMTAQYDYTVAAQADKIRLRRNAVALSPTYPNAANGAGTFTNQITYFLGRTGTQYLFDGRLHGMIGRFSASTAEEVSNTESWYNTKRIGAY